MSVRKTVQKMHNLAKIMSLFCLWIALSSASTTASASYDLQATIDAAKPGETIIPPAGIYKGNFTITNAITFDGSNGVILDAEGKGTVLLVKTTGATVQDMILRNSGRLHNELDSGIQVRGDFNILKNLTMENVLFGFDIQQSNNNIVKNNKINSRDVDLPLRGDAIRLWYSTENKILNNIITDSRDVVVWYSKNNRIAGNKIRRGRYGIHFMYSQYNLVEKNDIRNNTVGIFLMYSDGIKVLNNKIIESSGSSGMGIGFKETSDVIIAGNDVLGNSVGLYLDVSPYQPDSENLISDNNISFNGIGVQFHSDWKGNRIVHNDFASNFTQIVVRGGGSARRHLWDSNHWDSYEGFDKNKDGKGESPFDLWSYADRLWMDIMPISFFRGSPGLEALDFIERLAPFSEPKHLIRDQQPMMERIAGLDPVELKTNTIHPEPEGDFENEAETKRAEAGPAPKVVHSPPSTALQLLLKARQSQ
ncbi:nitrous oxidase accessory protein [Cohaesibacter gelatinilyticus]|uniref:Nitrous oxidase accessory protein n=2 Tax=Cohaesibacter gelatinilyticus TaxID=372072 RepID=A0A285NH25_9HYPH|nr:nitrous oxidase accessory protein [Cohaesibacter gelatinilyticus]